MAVNDNERGVRHRRTQAERSAATRSALVAAARTLFSAKGYAGTGREEIVDAAGVTRGAMYHHFSSKHDLFRAVYEGLEQEIMAGVAAAAVGAGPSPIAELRAGAAAYLDIAMDPGVQRVVVLDAPSVLDGEVRAAIAEAHALGMIREVLRAAIGAGEIALQPVEPLAHLLLAALHEAALYVARAEDPDSARQEIGTTVDRLLSTL